MPAPESWKDPYAILVIEASTSNGTLVSQCIYTGKLAPGEYKLFPHPPAPDSKRKRVTRESLQSDLSRDYLLNEAATRADYFYRQIDGDYDMPAPDGQVAQLIEMLLEASIKRPAPDKETIKRYCKDFFAFAYSLPIGNFEHGFEEFWQQQSAEGGE